MIKVRNAKETKHTPTLIVGCTASPNMFVA